MKICPFCGKEYEPEYPTKGLAKAYGTMTAREQWISGCCSSACWDLTTLELNPESWERETWQLKY